jgi:glycosyltransferase involved in cell wall biosynthesis
MPVVIGVLTTSYPRFAGDAAGSFVAARVHELRAAGHEVEVLAAGERGAPGDDEPGLRVVRLPCAIAGAAPLFYGAGAPEALETEGAGALLTGARFFAGLVAAARSRAERWQRLESHWLVPSGLAAAELANGRPHRAHAHSGDVALLERLPAGAALSRYLVGARRPALDIIFSSDDLRRRFARLSGCAVGRVEPLERRLGPGRGSRDPASRVRARKVLGLKGRTVLSVGRLVPVKGYDVLIRAAAVAAAAAPVAAPSGPGAPPTTLVIVGDGPERARLTELAHRLNVNLRLPGFVARHDVALWMAGADLYVQPSRRLPSGRTEGLPVATLEALACGVPVLASATGGLAELPHGPPRLWLVPPDDPAALAAAFLQTSST